MQVQQDATRRCCVGHTESRASGFSLLELVLVVTVMVIASAMAFPVLMNARRGYQLRTATVDLAAWLQRTRSYAIQANSTRGLINQAANTQFFLDLNGNGLYTASEPILQLPTNITQNNAVPTPLTAAILGFAPQNPPARFNGRGNPCVIVGAVCTHYPAGGAEVSFVYYMNQTINGNQRWSAVVVTPSGQVRTWSLSNGVWTSI